MDFNNSIFINEIKPMILSETKKFTQDALAKIDDTFFELYNNGISNKDANTYFHAMIDVRALKSELINNWNAQLSELINHQTVKKSDDISIDEIQILSEEEIELDIAIKAMAASFERDFRGLFQNIERAVYNIVNKGRDYTDGFVESELLTPEWFAKVACNWFASAPIDVKMKIIAFKVIEKEFAKILPSILNHCVLIFKNENGTKVNHNNYLHSNSSNGYSRKIDANAKIAKESVDFIEAFKNGFNAFGVPYYKQLQPSQTYDIHAFLNEMNSLSSFVSEQYKEELPQNYDVNINSLMSLLDKRIKLQEVKSALHGHKEDEKFITFSSIQKALQEIQKNTPQSILDAAIHLDKDEGISQVFKKELINQSRSYDNSADVNLDESSSVTVDIVGMLFEVFLSERQIIEEMRCNIARLIAPYIRIAFDDKKIFFHKDHPTRKFLDTLALALDGNSGVSIQEKSVIDKTKDQIESLVENFDKDVTIFEVAEKDIHQVISQVKMSIELAEKRAKEAEEAKERILIAENKTISFFNKSVESCNWPIKTFDTLKEWWTQHYKIQLLKGKQECIEECEGLLDKLVNAGNGVIEINESFKEEVNNAILNMLLSSGFQDQTAQNYKEDLYSLLMQASTWTKLAKEGKLTASDLGNTSTKEKRDKEAEVEQLQAKMAPSGVQKEEDNNQLDVNNADIDNNQTYSNMTIREIEKVFREMKVGTWVEFVSKTGDVIPCKLSFVSEISNRLLFITKRGIKYSVEAPNVLAMMVKMGTIRLNAKEPGKDGFDNSYKKAIENLM